MHSFRMKNIIELNINDYLQTSPTLHLIKSPRIQGFMLYVHSYHHMYFLTSSIYSKLGIVLRLICFLYFFLYHYNIPYYLVAGSGDSSRLGSCRARSHPGDKTGNSTWRGKENK